jgi:hypothetical protein
MLVLGCSNGVLEHGDNVLNDATMDDLYFVIEEELLQFCKDIVYVISPGREYNLRYYKLKTYTGKINADIFYIAYDEDSTSIWDADKVSNFMIRFNKYFDHDIFKAVRFSDRILMIRVDRECIYNDASVSTAFI